MKTKHYFIFLITLLSGFFINAPSMAGSLGLSQLSLDVIEGVDPNVVLLVDDSGSMDWEAMTTDGDNSFLFSGLQPNGDNTGVGTYNLIFDSDDVYLGNWSGSTLTTSEHACTGVGAYQYGWYFEDSTYSGGSDLKRLCDTALFDMWRFRNKDFNFLYYDPSRTYSAWPGLDEDGNIFTDIVPAFMPENPYVSSKESISIDHVYQSWQQYDFGGSTGVQWLAGPKNRVSATSEPDGFVYYTWSDTDGDGLFDDGEETKYSMNSSFATAEERQNFANWFGYYRSRELLTKAVLASALEEVTNVNLAYATLNNNRSVNLKLAKMNPSPTTGDKKAFYDKLFSTHSSNGTPLLEALDDVGKYYECESDNIFGVSGSDCPLAANTTANACRQNYAIVITDGEYNGDNPNRGNTDGDGDSDYDGGAFADDYSNTLADIAMYYYERDLNTSLADNVSVTNIDVARSTHVEGDKMHQHMATYIIGFGVEGTLNSIPSDYDDKDTWAEDWTDPGSDGLHKIDDLRHAAYNGRGLYLSAKNPTELEDSLDSIFESIGMGTASSSSVALNSQSLEQGSMVFRAFYNVGDNTGDVVAYPISLDGVISTTADWSAAQQLDSVITANTRNVISYKRTNATTALGIDFDTTNMTSTQLSALESPTPSNMPGAYGGIIADERVDYLRGDISNQGSNFDNGELRDRLGNKGRLGDIIHSSPVFVGTPRDTGRDSEPYPIATSDLYSKFYSDNKNRDEMLYLGANDGMLHGFNAKTGKEVFAYVPGNIYDNLAKLTNPDYSHQMYVDLTPSIEDVYIKTSDTATTQNWATVLVGGYRAGGKGYFALNVTDPDTLDTAAEAVDQVMWEFTETDDNDLGYSYSEPYIGMTNSGSGTTSEVDSGEVDGDGDIILTTITNKQWGVIFGNGYNSSSTDGDAALFILNMDGGLDDNWSNGDYIKISTGVGKAESADGTTPNGIGGIRAVDIDGNGTVDYVYAGDYQGNLFRFDLTSDDRADWDATLLFSAQIPSKTVKVKSVTTTTPGVDYPITVRPFVVEHPESSSNDPKLIVVFATGSWITSYDVSSTTVQSFYGVEDDLTSSPLVERDDLQEQSYSLKDNNFLGLKLRSLSDNSINWNNTKGWYIDLDDQVDGERAIDLQLRGGLGFATTRTPQGSNSCVSDMESFILTFDAITGALPENFVFDLNGDKLFDEDDSPDSGVVAGIGLGELASAPTIIGNLMIIPLEDGDLTSLGVQVGANNLEGKLSWQELEVPKEAY